MSQANDRDRGLPSLQQSRDQRRRAIVMGRVRLREAAPQFWLWTMVFFLAFGVIYWHWSERELGSQKAAVMARQRAVAQQLEPRLLPLRTKVEQWVGELASDWSGQVVAKGLNIDELSRSNGLYLRILHSQAGSPERIERAARTSLHDGFTSCLFVRQERTSEAQGAKCFSPAQCPDGELCNDWGLCSPPTQPFNLRLMYGALRLLSSGWTDELHAATSDYQVRMFERDLEKVVKTDVHIALQLAETARYFTAVLDEMPKEGISKHPDGGDAGVLGRPELRVQGQAHAVRVGIWELASGQQVFRARLQSAAEFVPMGRMKEAAQRSIDAQQRQVNNCAIAADLKDLVRSAQAPAEPAVPSAQTSAGSGAAPNPPPPGVSTRSVSPTAATNR